MCVCNSWELVLNFLSLNPVVANLRFVSDRMYKLNPNQMPRKNIIDVDGQQELQFLYMNSCDKH